jgi:type IV pilus assembly protein PilA
MVASVTTADNGVITATAINSNGLRGETYILIPSFKNDRTNWTVDGTCKTNVPAIC